MNSMLLLLAVVLIQLYCARMRPDQLLVAIGCWESELCLWRLGWV
uniref:Uncharacterized protein n=1 Tax=Populus trichocarpa TaxID=3694 RepID=A0A3N7FH31_POPTR